MYLSRQKLRLESARDEPDLRKLLAHLCTVEHMQGWVRQNPPSRMAPSPAQDVQLQEDQEGESSSRLRQVETEASMFHHWPTGDLRSTVTAVREVGDDDDDDEANGEDGQSSEDSWNGSDTSEDGTFGKYIRGVEASLQSSSSKTNWSQIFLHSGGQTPRPQLP
jgi:hypothetical protein